MRIHGIPLLALLALLGVPRAHAQGDGDSLPTKRAEPAPLFTGDSVVPFTLRANFKALLRNRDSTQGPRPGTLIVAGQDGAPDSIDVEVRNRGHFRRQKTTCDFPPILLKFDKGTKQTLFAKQKRLKLTTPCRARKTDWEQYVLEEYAIYRMYEALTPLSFRARLVRVTYEDSAGDMKPFTTPAFVIEDENAMAARNGGEILDAQNAVKRDLVWEDTSLLGLFEFLVANTDWSIGGLHNIRLVRIGQDEVRPVPYDFDWSGAINTPYARPDSRLGITNVTERLYRGYCATPEELAGAVRRLDERRDSLVAIVRGVPGLEAKRADQLVKWLADSYAIIDDPKRLRREVPRSCLQ